ncbi:MAG TPA: bifunctional UDP-N-acetylglucosamine diphosphorylase/glucosamine-1-phosphate N-acetyltransferase GlmU [Chloroflexota bacterium]|nr:bifunctional UDP-N-acetylglucosamine diphosphorylase/glucosamine-1-phosphate N-acetyltransferase GlmU [Chloroflexota bacterium]
MTTIAIVLAAGKGTRMRSQLPKVAHRLAGVPIILHIHAAIVESGDCTPLYVLGHQHEIVRAILPAGAATVIQEEQRGTGHAVQVAMSALPDDCDEVLVLYGDVPLLAGETLAALRRHHRRSGANLTVLSAEMDDPTGYGRVVRGPDGAPLAIVEQKWLSAEQTALREINTGLYVIKADWLRRALATLPQHGDGEVYLTDLAELAATDGGLAVMTGGRPEEVLGINDRVALAGAEQVMRGRIARRLMESGVTLIDPATAYIAADAAIGQDTIIEPNVWIDHGVTIGERCRIGSNSRVVASAIGDECKIDSSVIEYAELESQVTVGPFAHLRAGTALAPHVHIGNFAEVKNSSLGTGTKVGHFSYLGDAVVGAEVNIGAGAVTANYDGTNKYPTTIGDHAFVGVGSMLRAPLSLGANSTTGAGSVVLHDVAPGATVAGVPAQSLSRSARPDGSERPLTPEVE